MKKFFSFLINIILSFVVCNAQNIGIGTTTPTEKLQVAGNIKTDTIKPNSISLIPNAGIGKVLTSDATGNGAWQESKTSGGAGFGSWGDCSINGISEYLPVADSDGSADDYFGSSVSISGNFAIVAAHGDDNGAFINQGSVTIYQNNGSGWTFMQRLTDASALSYDYFGSSVSISGNYAIVGTSFGDIGANANQGYATIFRYNGTGWVFFQKISDPSGAAGDFFGGSVSISGNFAAVGCRSDDVGANVDQGSASVFWFNGTSWVYLQLITDPTGSATDGFGNSVSIAGNTLIVGSATDNIGANTDQGSVCIYRYNGSTWAFMQQLTDPAGAANDNYGNSVSIYGDYAIVGVRFDDVGANIDQGSAFTYHYNGSTWVLMQQLTDPAGASNDSYGNSVAISGNYIIVGAPSDQVGATIQGSATIYGRLGTRWQKIQYVTDPAASANDLFGVATALDGQNLRFIIGAYGYAGNVGKAIFGKIN